MIAAADVARLAALASAEAQRYPARSAERRAAAALWAALITTKTIDGARSALEGFAAPSVRGDALQLLDRLVTTVTSSPTEEATR